MSKGSRLSVPTPTGMILRQSSAWVKHRSVLRFEFGLHYLGLGQSFGQEAGDSHEVCHVCVVAGAGGAAQALGKNVNHRSVLCLCDGFAGAVHVITEACASSICGDVTHDTAKGV